MKLIKKSKRKTMRYLSCIKKSYVYMKEKFMNGKYESHETRFGVIVIRFCRKLVATTTCWFFIHFYKAIKPYCERQI